MRKSFSVLLVLGLLSICSLAQEKRGPSTKEERDRAVAFAQQVENSPLTSRGTDDTRWFIAWIADVPDISVTICSVTGLPYEKKYKFGSELMLVSMSASVRFLIENPEKKDDRVAAGLAGLEALLRAYKTVVASDPKAHSKAIDAILEIQSQGKLADYVKERWEKECTAKK